MDKIRHARMGKFLSPERWNPQTETFFEELVRPNDEFRKTLDDYLKLPQGERQSYPKLEESVGIGIGTLRSIANGNREYAPRESYKKIADNFGLSAEVDTDNVAVRGQYAAMIAAYNLDRQGMSGPKGISQIAYDLASVDENIAVKLKTTQGKSNVNQYIRDFLVRASNMLPLTLLEQYEQDIKDAYGLAGISREQLMEAFKGPIESIETRLNQLSGNSVPLNTDHLPDPTGGMQHSLPTGVLGTRENPKGYSYAGGFTSDDYNKGEFITHPHPRFSNLGLGEVISRNNQIMEVRFDDGSQNKFMVNPKS